MALKAGADCARSRGWQGGKDSIPLSQGQSISDILDLSFYTYILRSSKRFVTWLLTD